MAFFFFGGRYFKTPKKIRFNDKIINLDLPNEYGIKIIFVEIFLDDVYQLGWINNFAKKKGIQIKSILDIGGNCGLTSLLSRSYFPNSIIHCYEPNIEIKKHLEHSSNLGNFDYFTEAVGKKSGMVKLNIDENESVLSSIMPNQIGKTHPYMLMLESNTANLLRAIKTHADPKSLFNPGVLGL